MTQSRMLHKTKSTEKHEGLLEIHIRFWLLYTINKIPDLPCLEQPLLKFQDIPEIPSPVGTLLLVLKLCCVLGFDSRDGFTVIQNLQHFF